MDNGRSQRCTTQHANQTSISHYNAPTLIMTMNSNPLSPSNLSFIYPFQPLLYPLQTVVYHHPRNGSHRPPPAPNPGRVRPTDSLRPLHSHPKTPTLPLPRRPQSSQRRPVSAPLPAMGPHLWLRPVPRESASLPRAPHAAVRPAALQDCWHHHFLPPGSGPEDDHDD